ncbi:MAG: cytochrome c-type biogenesis protein CcmH [Rhodospirillales bacterium]|jgi:cytochrome c-type biogenesis protein CcmH|tara:strand:+ start:1063 stop:1509 length:447 start_codon:yes stop_codon:yes gene_type:complete
MWTLLSALPANAVNPNEILSDPALEARARDISKGLRCLVCQNQSIDDSDASLAKDLRVLVRERITAGDSNDQVVTYVVSRYGDFVLLKPPFNMATLVLWLGPLLLILGGLIAAILFFRKNKKIAAPASAPLTEAEKMRVAELLAEDNQ